MNHVFGGHIKVQVWDENSTSVIREHMACILHLISLILLAANSLWNNGGKNNSHLSQHDLQNSCPHGISTGSSNMEAAHIHIPHWKKKHKAKKKLNKQEWEAFKKFEVIHMHTRSRPNGKTKIIRNLKSAADKNIFMSQVSEELKPSAHYTSLALISQPPPLLHHPQLVDTSVHGPVVTAHVAREIQWCEFLSLQAVTDTDISSKFQILDNVLWSVSTNDLERKNVSIVKHSRSLNPDFIHLAVWVRKSCSVHSAFCALHSDETVHLSL